MTGVVPRRRRRVGACTSLQYRYNGHSSGTYDGFSVFRRGSATLLHISVHAGWGFSSTDSPGRRSGPPQQHATFSSERHSGLFRVHWLAGSRWTSAESPTYSIVAATSRSSTTRLHRLFPPSFTTASFSRGAAQRGVGAQRRGPGFFDRRRCSTATGLVCNGL